MWRYKSLLREGVPYSGVGDLCYRKARGFRVEVENSIGHSNGSLPTPENVTVLFLPHDLSSVSLFSSLPLSVDIYFYSREQ